MTTIGDLIDEVQNKLMREVRTELNTLDQAMSDSTTSVELSYPTDQVLPGTLLGIDDEVCYVVSYDDHAHVATVIRGRIGTTAAAHDAGATVFVDARFFPGEIVTELRNEIRDLSDRLFSVTSTNVTFAAGQRMVDLGVSASEVFRVTTGRARSSDLTTGYVDYASIPIHLIRDVPVADFPSGYAVRIDQPFNVDTTVRVTYAHGFEVATLTRATDLEADVGLEPFMFDIPAYGTCYRLLGPRDAERSAVWARGSSEAGDQTQPLTAIRTAEWYRLMRNQLIGDAQARLLGRYPWARR